MLNKILLLYNIIKITTIHENFKSKSKLCTYFMSLFTYIIVIIMTYIGISKPIIIENQI